MFNFFRRKKKGLINRLKFISENKNVNFQLDMLRENQVDFQMTRQKSLKKIGFNEYEDPYNIAFSLRFEVDNIYKNNFLNSMLYDKAVKLEVFGETYIILCKNDFNSIKEKIDQIGKEVYNCDYKESAIIFNIIP